MVALAVRPEPRLRVAPAADWQTGKWVLGVEGQQRQRRATLRELSADGAHKATLAETSVRHRFFRQLSDKLRCLSVFVYVGPRREGAASRENTDGPPASWSVVLRPNWIVLSYGNPDNL
jgi:hypothetical protein